MAAACAITCETLTPPVPQIPVIRTENCPSGTFLFLRIRPPPRSTLLPYTTLFRSARADSRRSRPHAGHGISSRDPQNRIRAAQRTADAVLFRDAGSVRRASREGLHAEPGATGIRVRAEAVRECPRTGFRGCKRSQAAAVASFARQGNRPLPHLHAYQARSRAPVDYAESRWIRGIHNSRWAHTIAAHGGLDRIPAVTHPRPGGDRPGFARGSLAGRGARDELLLARHRR